MPATHGAVARVDRAVDAIVTVGRGAAHASEDGVAPLLTIAEIPIVRARGDRRDDAEPGRRLAPRYAIADVFVFAHDGAPLDAASIDAALVAVAEVVVSAVEIGSAVDRGRVDRRIDARHVHPAILGWVVVEREPTGRCSEEEAHARDADERR
jgi:hypothetical protein